MIQSLTDLTAPMVFEIDPNKFDIPYKVHQGGRQITLDIGTFKKGDYQVWLEGSDGENHELKWKSEVGKFRIN